MRFKQTTKALLVQHHRLCSDQVISPLVQSSTLDCFHFSFTRRNCGKFIKCRSPRPQVNENKTVITISFVASLINHVDGTRTILSTISHQGTSTNNEPFSENVHNPGTRAMARKTLEHAHSARNRVVLINPAEST